MEPDKYIVIYRTEDEPHFNVMNKEQVENFLASIDEFGDYDFLDNPYNIDLDDFPDWSILIFKGKSVVPKAITTVTKWEV